jgi:DNA repair exonuclease SbcCD nuclease subunit
MLSDPHVHKFNSYASVVDNIHSRVFYTLDVLRQIFSYAKSNSIKHIFIAGDIFDTKSYLDVGVFTLTQQMLVNASKWCNIYMIPGNHDMAERGRYNSLSTFNGFASVCDTPRVFDLGDTTVGMIPFMYGRNEIVTAIQETRSDILIAHEGIIGACIEGKRLIEETIKKSGITIDEALSGGHKKVFLGHFHDPFCLDHPDIQFIGAPLHMDANDEGKRGFWVYDTVENISDFIETSFPRYIKLDEKDLKKIKDVDLKDLCSNNYVRVAIQKMTPKIKALLDDCNVTIDYQKPIEEKDTRSDITLLDSDEIILGKYVDKYAVEEDRPRLLQLGLDIINGE